MPLLVKHIWRQIVVLGQQVWFWRFRPEHREVVRGLQAKEAVKRRAVKQLFAERDRLLSHAKAQLGLWSDAGLEESRQLFWSALAFAATLCLLCSKCRVSGHGGRSYTGLGLLLPVHLYLLQIA